MSNKATVYGPVTVHVLGMACAGWAQGSHWGVVQQKPSRHFLGAVSFVDALHGWASGDSMYYTIDGGRSWLSAGEVTYSPFAYVMLDTLQGWTIGTQGAYTGIICHTADGGRSWQKQLDGDRYRLPATCV